MDKTLLQLIFVGKRCEVFNILANIRDPSRLKKFLQIEDLEAWKRQMIRQFLEGS